MGQPCGTKGSLKTLEIPSRNQSIDPFIHLQLVYTDLFKCASLKESSIYRTNYH